MDGAAGGDVITLLYIVGAAAGDEWNFDSPNAVICWAYVSEGGGDRVNDK